MNQGLTAFWYSDPPSFEYHLNPQEQESVEKLFPLHQAKIHLAFRAKMMIGDKVIPEGAMAVSEHFITLCKPKFVGKGYSLITTLRFLDLTQNETVSDSYANLGFDKVSVYIYTGCAVRFTRTILRNCLLFTLMHPKEAKLKFKPHNSESFPPFQPKVSFSQAIQFSYAAHCSYNSTTYFQEVIQTIHSNIQLRSGLLNINEFPLPLIERSIGNPMSFYPLFASMMYSDFIYGVAASDINRSDILLSSIPMLSHNKNIRFLSFSKCNITDGLSELAKILTQLKICYFDLSYNLFHDLIPFCAALREYKSPVYYLNLGMTEMNSSSTEYLTESFTENAHFSNLDFLDISGAAFSSKSILSFIDFFKQLQFKNRVISHLNISECKRVDNLIQNQKFFQVGSLKISNINQKNYSPNLMDFVQETQSLTSLDISGTNIPFLQLKNIIGFIVNNENFDEFYLDIGNSNLTGERLLGILPFFSQSSIKWSKIGFRGHAMNKDYLSRLLYLLKEFPDLLENDLSENFHFYMQGIGEMIAYFHNIGSLLKFSIKGNAKLYL